MEEDIANIDVNTAIDEVGKIFGRNSKNKLKTLVKNMKVYPDFDSLKKDIEILADKSKFDQLLLSTNMYLENIRSFSSNDLIGEIITSEFGTVFSKSTIATVKSVHGLSENVYQYEVQLKSNGPMHLGWASKNCVFSSILGVGGTENSYGFDGYHLLKSNTNMSLPYGKKWRIGNIIGCVINFPKKTMEYFNNGRSLGIAFNKFEDGSTYFPALTLSNEEHVAVNFGQRPFTFPIQGTKPIIDSPIAQIKYYKRMEQTIVSLIDNQIGLETNTKSNLEYSGKVSINNVIKNVLFYQLMSLLKIPYIVAACFIPFLNYLNKKSPKRIKVLLKLMWESIPEKEMVSILDSFMFCMLCEFQCTWRNKFNISHQIIVLKLLIEICQETNSRRQLIVHILFNKTKFAHFLHIVAPSDDMFNQMLPSIYWSIENVDLEEKEKKKLSLNFPRADYKSRKSSYNSACDKIKHLLSELVNLQTLFVKTLLNDNDQTDTKVSSRILFSRQFQSFVQENMIYWRNDPILRLPGPVLLSTLFRLSFVVRELWNEELAGETDIKTQPNTFYLEKYNFFGIDRIGGTFSYLNTKYGEHLKSKLGISLNSTIDQNDSISNYSADEEEIVELNSAAGLITILTRIMVNTGNRNSNIHSEALLNRIYSFDSLPTDKNHVFSVILNNIICLYHIAGHRQLVEYVSFKDRLTDLSVDYAITEYELRTVNDNDEDLKLALKVFEDKIIITSRHIAWLMSLIFIDSNEKILEWILTVISNTVKYCSETEEELFRFVPEYYIDNMLGLIVLVPDFTNRTQQFQNIIIDRERLAVLIGELLLNIFGDPRIIYPRSKETIIQGITLYLTHPKSVGIIQAATEESRLQAIKSIFKPTERNSWSKTNVILMLIWYGSGFAFRYIRPPHLEDRNISIKGPIEEVVFSNMGTERPAAEVLQNDVRKVIADDKESSSHFINSSLNYLNWTFSEFISLFQEVKDINRNYEFTISPDELNKLKLCGRHFILTVTLLRVLEMMIHFDPNLIIDQEGSLGRVFQLICQILNRVKSSTSTFQHVLTSYFPYVECVHKFPILVPTIGVLLSILKDETIEIDVVADENISNSRKISSIPKVTDALISDPNFNLSSLDFIILPENENDEPFSFNSYKTYFTEEELHKVDVMYKHLDWYLKRHNSMAANINEEDLCIICYSNKNSVTLKPCEHLCCKLCINHHILYSRVCFYCKTRIEMVMDINDSTIVIHNFGSEPPPLL